MLLLCTLLLLSGNLYAQNDEDSSTWFLNKKISGFQYEGLKVISRADMNNVLSDYVGKKFTYELLQEIQQVLYEINFFEELTPEARRGPNDELIIFFTFLEHPSVSRIKFVGNKKKGISTLLSSINLRRHEIVNDIKLQQSVRELEKYYYGQGYPKAEIRYELEPDPNVPEKVIVTFFVTENNRISITAISFTGNKIFSEKKLEGIISSRKKSIFNKGTYSEEQITNDRRLIEEAYQQKGFIEAEVLDVNVSEAEDPDTPESVQIELQFIIKEGVQYFLNDIELFGNIVFSTEELRKLFPIKNGDILNVSKLQAGYAALGQHYSNEGFMFNNYNVEEERDDTTNKITYKIFIQENKQSHIENIILRGNIVTKDFVIERELGFEEGEVFSARAIAKARNSLLSTRYFKNVIPETKPGSENFLVDLILNLEEDRSRDIRVGMTFGGSVEFPISLFFSWNQPNLFGRGLTWNNSIVASFGEQSIKSVFIEPHFLGSDFLLSASVLFSHEIVNNVPQDLTPPFLNSEDQSVNYDPYTEKYVFTGTKNYNDNSYESGDPFPGTPTESEITSLGLKTDSDYFSSYLNSVHNNSLMSYDVYQLGFTLGSGYTYAAPIGNLGVKVNAGPTFSYVHYDKTSFRAANIQIRKNLENWRVFNSLGLTLFFDNRDIYFMPSSGYRVQQSFIFVGGLLFGDAHYIKTNTTAEAHFTLFDWKVAQNWSWKMVLSAQTSFSTILPQFFYPSGTSYETDGPTYHQKLRLNGISNARGWYRIYNGEAVWNTWLELRMPLYEPVIWWDQIFEVAALWPKLSDLGSENTKYYFTFGSGFRFVLRQFPLRVYFAKRFLVQEGEVQWQRGNLTSSDDLADTSGLDLIFTISIFD